MSLESVTFWLNAFIPSSVCELKGNLFVLRAPNGRLFAGDQREFSPDPDASARMHSEVTLDMQSSETARLASQGHVCGESHEVDDDGNIIASATAPTDRMAFFNLRREQTVDAERGVIDGIPDVVQIDVAGSASLPLILVPDIDYSGTFIVDRAEGNVLFRGAVSGFPAFEIYFRVNGGPVGVLATIPPIGPPDVFGEAHRRVAVAAGFSALV